MRYDDVTELIGNTPLLRLRPDVHGLPGVEMYAKLEMANPFGSVKDRAAWGMVAEVLDDVQARGQTFIEASSGNTAKALQVLAAMRGLHLHALTNRVRVDEVRDTLRLLGAQVQELPGLSECPDPTVPDDVFSAIDRMMAAEPGTYHHASQYTNLRNVEAHYRGTGSEIAADLGRVDVLVGGMGTTGSTRGVAERLAEDNPDLRTVGVVSARDDVIPGIRSEAEMWEVGLFERDRYDEVVAVTSTRAIDGTLTLARRYGVLAGPTSGATYEAALEVLARLVPGQDRPLVAVLIVCDRLEPYLSYVRARRPDLFDAATSPAVGQAAAEDVASAPEISPGDLDALTGRPGLLCVDTRGAMAFRVGHVPGSVNVTDDLLDRMFESGVPFSPGLHLVFVCPMGEVSRRYAARCRRAGLDAVSLAGGILRWRDEGRPLEPGLR